MLLAAPSDQWTADRFVRNGFPQRDFPTGPVIKGSVSTEGLLKLRAEREQKKPFSPWEEETFDTLFDWCKNGCPDDSETYPPPNKGRHHLEGEDLEMAIDAVAKFVSKGFIFGPCDPKDWPLKEPHCIGIFTREQKNTGKPPPRHFVHA